VKQNRNTRVIIPAIYCLLCFTFLLVLTYSNGIIFGLSNTTSINPNTNVTTAVYINGTQVLKMEANELRHFDSMCGVDWPDLGNPEKPFNC